MLELLRNLDNSLFVAINHLPHNFLLDTLFGLVTAMGYFGFVFLVFTIVLALKNKKNTRKLLTAVVWAEVMYFFLVEYLIKNYFARLRPQFVLPDAIFPYDFSQSFSFPSGHAAIAFALSYILGRIDKKRTIYYYLLAILVSFSRIYLGKHYPSDVAVGTVLGICIGFVSMKLVNKK